jgi:hypothetical protein
MSELNSLSVRTKSSRRESHIARFVKAHGSPTQGPKRESSDRRSSRRDTPLVIRHAKSLRGRTRQHGNHIAVSKSRNRQILGVDVAGKGAAITASRAFFIARFYKT